MKGFSRTRVAVGLSALVLALAPRAVAATGGAQYAPPPPPPPPPALAAIVNGKAIAPPGAPLRVKHVLVAANRLVRKPYRWGGGHASFLRPLDSGYDCSGAVSYALFGGRFLAAPLASRGLERWAQAGAGGRITVFSNKGHAFLVVAGLRFDTAIHDPDAPAPGSGPRWSSRMRDPKGFVARHPRAF
jgi:hypothetical protein